MKVVIAAGLLIALLAGCKPGAGVQPPGDPTARGALRQGVEAQEMPIATAQPATNNLLEIAPLVRKLNDEWKPLVLRLKPGNGFWLSAGVLLVDPADKLSDICVAHQPTLKRGDYCRAKQFPRGDSNLYHGFIVLPDEPFKKAVEDLPKDQELAVMIVVGYFYALHLREVLDKAGLVETPWGALSRTHWCLIGASLRALWLQSPAPPSAEQIPLPLTYHFGEVPDDDRHAVWVLEGLQAPNINRCFT